ncbi:ABC transporter permease [Kaistia dalseonensis]|uniref:Simple sugar transport system permease protein n=1 Tax=Kaistia dalseonensis TaxID=410840 RepID=A0ABU0HAS2_9HYPH|nr:ABC transporter permease [Kaistia dalseonensis]MCX5496786.1 ABC transporter permease [Kaistia dalseonensis]MDQ0439411.1 simple sugar transport system permease protein [Kaistia dalseonensis]
MTFLTDPTFVGFLSASMRLAIPIMLAALGGLFAERSGVLNIGLEGMMLVGAFVGFVATFWTGQLWIGVIIAVLAGMVFGLILGFYTITLGANQVVVGIAMNLLAVGVTSFFYRMAFGAGTDRPRIDSFTPLDLGPLVDIPVIGPLLFRQDALAYLGLGLILVTWFVMAKTRFGLNVRAVGEHPQAAETLGVDVQHIRYVAIGLSGGLAGLGGAFLSLSATGVFLDNMTAGRGYIALAILILGRRHAIGVLLAALLFGAADALQLRAQILPTGVPFQFLLMLPYVLTIIVLAGFVGRNSAPAALGVPFRRGRSGKDD